MARKFKDPEELLDLVNQAAATSQPASEPVEMGVTESTHNGIVGNIEAGWAARDGRKEAGR